MTKDALLTELLAARQARTPCALVTVAATTGSVPRAAGSKMLVYSDGKISGTIGGGKFEALVVEETLAALGSKQPVLKSYPLHEGDAESFGAICGGEATVLIEPQMLSEAIYLVGGGHCARAIAKLAVDAGFFVSVIEDRAEFLDDLPLERRSCQRHDARLSSLPLTRGRAMKRWSSSVAITRSIAKRWPPRAAERFWLHRHDWEQAEGAAGLR